jgi:hypothetical protein
MDPVIGKAGAEDPSASRHRSHRYPGRHKALLVRYDDAEFGVIARAAALAGLTPTGFVASVALAVAQATGRDGSSPGLEKPPR